MLILPGYEGVGGQIDGRPFGAALIVCGVDADGPQDFGGWPPERPAEGQRLDWAGPGLSLLEKAPVGAAENLGVW